jgi:hypothetical protein
LKTVGKFVYEVAKESSKEIWEELVVDPVIEKVAADLIRDWGGDEATQMIGSVLVSSFREALTSGIRSGVGSMFKTGDLNAHTDVQTQADTDLNLLQRIRQKVDTEVARQLAADAAREYDRAGYYGSKVAGALGKGLKFIGQALSVIAAFTPFISFNPFTAVMSGELIAAGNIIKEDSDANMDAMLKSELKAIRKSLPHKNFADRDIASEGSEETADPSRAYLYDALAARSSVKSESDRVKDDLLKQKYLTKIDDPHWQTLTHRLLMDRSRTIVKKSSMHKDDTVYNLKYPIPFTFTAPEFHIGEVVRTKDGTVHRIDNLYTNHETGEQMAVLKGDRNAHTDDPIPLTDIVAHAELNEKASLMLEQHQELGQTMIESYGSSNDPEWYSWGTMTPQLVAQRQQPSQRNELIDDLRTIIGDKLGNVHVSDPSMSALLFKDKTTPRSYLTSTFKDQTGSNSRPRFSTLLGLIYNIRTMKLGDIEGEFGDTGLDADGLDELKGDLEEYIVDFIFRNPYSTDYINTRRPGGAEYHYAEFDVTLEVWYALSRKVGHPITITKMQHMLGLSTFGSLGLDRTSYSIYTIMQIRDLMRTELDFHELMEFEPELAKYISIRNLQYKDLDYHKDWQKLETIKFHVVMLLLLDLGLDMKTLDAIPPEVFMAKLEDRLKFIRHHIFKNDKMTMDLDRLVLVLNTLHADLESDPDLVKTLAEKRRQWPDRIPQEYYDVFGDNTEKLERNWKELIKRRDFLKREGIVEYIKEYYTNPKTDENYIIDRFFRGIPDYMIEDNIRCMVYRWIGNGNDFDINALPGFLRDTLFPTSQQPTYTKYLGSI